MADRTMAMAAEVAMVVLIIATAEVIMAMVAAMEMVELALNVHLRIIY